MIVNVEPSWENSDEHKALALAGLKCKLIYDPDPEAILIGSVKYCRKLHPWPACDPYPDWIRPMGRRIYRDFAPPGPLFYKPADIPKRFASEILSEPAPWPWVASEILDFVAEWRAYVVDGQILGIFCYSDFERDYSPAFPWTIPETITAAIDFGLNVDGRFLLVEVNDPYAIGWYGKLSQYQIYADFIVAGWQSMLRRQCVGG